MQKNWFSGQRLFYLLIILFLSVFFLRFLPALRFVILGIVFFGAVAFAIYYLVDFLVQYKKKQEYENSIEGIIGKQIKKCDEELSSNTKEISEILRNIQDLKVRLTGDLEIPKHQREKTERLIEGFKKELDLRETKINFYETCIHKLKGLLNGQILSKELKEKQKKLKLLREDHQEDMAKMEEMKSDMEFDHFYLDTIDNLSLRMLSSESLADAEQVQLELEEMTREIDEEV